MALAIDNSGIEAIVPCSLQSGAFATVHQVLLDALAEESLWDNPAPDELAWLDEKLKRSIAQLDSGEGIPLEELRPATRCRPRILAQSTPNHKTPVVIAAEALDDLRGLWRDLANEVGMNLADRIREKLLAASDRVARHSGIGRKRRDLTSLAVRFYSVYRHPG